MLEDEIQFEYKLNDISFYCKYCKERVHIKETDIKANTYLCKCKHLYKIPFHYRTTYHNKKLKEFLE